VDPAHRQGNAELPAQRPAEADPIVGVRAEPVVNVDRAHRKVAGKRMQQDDRVYAAGQADADGLASQNGKRTPDGVRHWLSALRLP
jgi:hypothetical protein